MQYTARPQPTQHVVVAAQAAALGLRCFPCDDDKRPAILDWPHRASADPDAIHALWRESPGALVGVPTGEPLGADVIDINRMGLWWWRDQWRGSPGPLVGVPPPTDVLDIDRRTHLSACRHWVDTHLHRTPSGGWHAFFGHHPGLRHSAIAPGVYVLSTGDYVIWWPIRGYYRSCDAPLADWPADILAAALARPKPPPAAAAEPVIRQHDDAYLVGALRSAADRVAGAPEGYRNNTLNNEAYSLARLGGLSSGDIRRALRPAALQAGLPLAEVEATIRSALRARGRK